MGDWLGTGTVAPRLRTFRPFAEAHAFVHTLRLEKEADWRRYCKGELSDKPPKPDDIPAVPSRTYRGQGWISMGDWLGTGRVADQLREYRPFAEARAFVHQLKLEGQAEWRRYYKGELPDKPPKPDDIPANPNQTYRDQGWIGMGDWLGTGTVAPRLRTFRPFAEARAFVRKLKLGSAADWRRYCKGKLTDRPAKPDDIPTHPDRTYRDQGWAGMSDWLGTGTVAP